MVDIKSFDRVAHVYDETRGQPPEIANAVSDALFGVMSKVAEKPRVVEIGIGTGRIAVPLAERGARVTGIDVSPKMLSVLRSKRRPPGGGDIDVMFAEASRPPLRDGVFDAALFVHILHLVPDPEATVRAVFKLVRSGGVIIEGRDDRITGLRDQADVMVRETVKELSGVEMVDWAPHERGTQLLTQLVQDAGGTVERTTVAHWSSTTTARLVIERIARRDYSSSWAITDEILPAVLEGVTPRIVELFGGLDTEIEAPRSFSLTIGRLP